MRSYLDIKEIHSACRKCKMCDLSKTRNNVVAAKGNPSAKIFIIGAGGLGLSFLLKEKIQIQMRDKIVILLIKVNMKYY